MEHTAPQTPWMDQTFPQLSPRPISRSWVSVSINISHLSALCQQPVGNLKKQSQNVGESLPTVPSYVMQQNERF